jgi:hypothetical protein
MKRTIVSILILTMACTIQGFISAGSYAGQQPAAESQGPILGKWTESEKDFRTRKVTVTKTGVWSARYTGP